VEASALLAGHGQTVTTEVVYRHQIVPALTSGAEVMVRSLARRSDLNPLGERTWQVIKL
jgi:hypothetical protein